VLLNKNTIHYQTQWKGNLALFCSGYMQHHSNKKILKCHKKNCKWRV